MPIAPRKKLPRISKAEAIRTGKKYYFDPKKAQHAVDFFENFLIHSKGQFAGQPFILLPWQKHDIIEELFGWQRVDTDTRKYRVGYISVPKKNGKALSIETPIPTPNGWKQHGSLKAGDSVFGVDGKVRRVIATTPHFTEDECYVVKFSDGEEIIAHGNHYWWTESRRLHGLSFPSHYSKHDRDHIRTTKQIKDTLLVSPQKRGNSMNHKVPLCRPVSYEEKNLPIDPYVLGVWLGDGTSGDTSITHATSDREIRTLIEKTGAKTRDMSSPRPGIERFSIDTGVRRGHAGMRSKLSRLGLLKNKHIPDVYRHCSVSQRVDLVQGLMDTDGSVSFISGNEKYTVFEFTNKNEQIIDGFIEVLRSLGVKPGKSKCRSMSNGSCVGHYYRVRFHVSDGDDFIPFRLTRKALRVRPPPRTRQRSKSRTVVSVEKVPPVPMNCIQVDSPDGLYLAGRGFIPTHNSTLLSGISLYTLIADGEPAAECFGAANSREQADILFRTIKELVEASPELDELLEIVDSRKHIACVPTSSFWKVISSDAGRQEGHNIHSCVVDEIHQAKDRKLWAALRYGGIARRQSLIVAITTAGSNIDSICYELNEHALKCMQDPEFDEQFFGYVTGATLEDDYRDPEVWRAANPSYGETMDEASFVSDLKDAEGSKTKLADFLRYRLNVWVAGENKFVDLEKWDKCKRAYPKPGPERLWYCGLDLAQTWDVNAFVAVSKALEGDQEVFDVICRFWIPEVNASKRRENVPYVLWAQDFEKSGLVLTPGDSCDYDFIKREILDFCKVNSVQKIACDPHNAHHIQNQLQEQGVSMVAFNQAPSSMNGPVKLLDTLIAQGRLRTRNNPILNVHASNCVVKTNAEGYVKIMKPSAMSPNRVDGMVALAMALWMANDAPGSIQTAPQIFVL